MTPLKPEAAAALFAAQGHPTTPEAAEAYARFVTLQLDNSAKAFEQLGFEEEPPGYTAALRAHTR